MSKMRKSRLEIKERDAMEEVLRASRIPHDRTGLVIAALAACAMSLRSQRGELEPGKSVEQATDELCLQCTVGAWPRNFHKCVTALVGIPHTAKALLQADQFPPPSLFDRKRVCFSFSF